MNLFIQSKKTLDQLTIESLKTMILKSQSILRHSRISKGLTTRYPKHGRLELLPHWDSNSADQTFHVMASTKVMNQNEMMLTES